MPDKQVESPEKINSIIEYKEYDSEVEELQTHAQDVNEQVDQYEIPDNANPSRIDTPIPSMF